MQIHDCYQLQNNYKLGSIFNRELTGVVFQLPRGKGGKENEAM